MLKGDLHDTFIVGEDRLVAIPEIKSPDLHVLVGRTGYDEFGVVRNVHRQDGKLFCPSGG